MKLNILSDLHLSRGALEIPRNDADVVILAGDIGRPAQAAAWAAGFAKPVLYVPGNHEFYGSSIADTVAELRRLFAGTGIHVLDDDEIVIGGVRFLGSTLWTDFLLHGKGERREASMREGQAYVRDFSQIRSFSPEDSTVLFDLHSAWLSRKLAEPHTGPTVVITHHAPTRMSIHPRFAGSLLNACFVSDAEALVRASRACLWIHGHTHDSFDYRVAATRVVCNPRGYAKNGVNENPRFDANFIVDTAATGSPA